MSDFEEQSNQPAVGYPSLIHRGEVPIELPQPDLTNIAEGMYSRSDMRQLGETDRIQARAYGPHVAQRVEAAFAQRGPVSAAAVLSHYVECGTQVLLDPASAKELRSLTDGMAKSRQPEEFYRRSVKPFLLALKPHARER